MLRTVPRTGGPPSLTNEANAANGQTNKMNAANSLVGTATGQTNKANAANSPATAKKGTTAASNGNRPEDLPVRQARGLGKRAIRSVPTHFHKKPASFALPGYSHPAPTPNGSTPLGIPRSAPLGGIPTAIPLVSVVLLYIRYFGVCITCIGFSIGCSGLSIGLLRSCGGLVAVLWRANLDDQKALSSGTRIRAPHSGRSPACNVAWAPDTQQSGPPDVWRKPRRLPRGAAGIAFHSRT